MYVYVCVLGQIFFCVDIRERGGGSGGGVKLKYICFTCIFGEKLLFFDRPKHFYFLISSVPSTEIQFFPVNQLIKKCWP